MTIDVLIDEIIKCNNLDDLKISLKGYMESSNLPSIVDKYQTPAKDILSHLNTLNGTKLTAIGKIAQRLSEGYSVNDLKRIAEVKCDEWGDDKTMAKYLRPQTLYGSRDKVNKYMDQVKLNDNFIKKQVAKSRPDSIVLPKFI